MAPSSFMPTGIDGYPNPRNLTPTQIVEAHRFLYYVLYRPVLTDQQFDDLEKAAGGTATPGSDDPNNYEPAVRRYAHAVRWYADTQP